MERETIEQHYGYHKRKRSPLSCTVWKNGKLVMDKGVVLDDAWWEAKIARGKFIKNKIN